MSTALITGGSRGIGREICAAFARAGYDVAFTYTKDEAGARETVRRIQEAGAGALAFRCDVSDAAAVHALFGQIFGLSVLVNNAGVAFYGDMQSTTPDILRRLFAVNVEGAFYCMREAIGKFLARGEGSIVNVASVWGETGGSCEVGYSASKAALIGLTKAAAKELGPSDIRVNCVSPGMVDTDMTACLSAEAKAEFCSALPPARAGTPAEVAEAVLFLAKQRFMTGEVLRVNGGCLI